MKMWTVALFLTTGLGAQVVLTPPVTTIVMIRNAEMTQGPGGPKMTDAGTTRAKNWSLSLSLFHPEALYATTGPITQATLQPTAKRLGLKTAGHPTSDIKGLARNILSNHKGKTVVVCWPAKDLKPLALALGVPEPITEWPPEIANQIWVVWLDAKGAGAIDTGTQVALPDPAGPSGYAAVWGITH